MSLITKQDLIERTRISANLADRQVLPFILDAHTYDLPTLLSGKLIREVSGLNITFEAWNTDAEYVTDTYASEAGFIWKALTGNTGSRPVTDSVNWQKDLNATLRYLHLKDFLCWSAYRRLLLEHGRNITEAGITNPTDPQATYQPATDKARAEMIASATSKADFHKAQIERFLHDNGMITRTPCAPYRPRGNGRITAI